MAEDSKCTSCAEKGHTCIPFFVHENAMMHKDTDNERMHETIEKLNEKHQKNILAVCATFILIIVIFVTAYTIRTSIWLNTVNHMNDIIVELSRGHSAGSEVDDAVSNVHQQSD